MFKPYLNQAYDEIKQKCLESGELFVDESFPCDDSSLFRINKKNNKNIVWKRPHEICENPQFIVDSIVPNDLDQGEIGDCWLISACSAVATVPDYCNRVIPSQGQSFAQSEYAGVFHFRVWRYGEWLDVVVDDYLPVDSESDSLVYCHNTKDTNEMFGPLLEKAFAKLNTCYEFLDGGDLVDALIDMTGGVGECFGIKQNSNPNSTFVEKNVLWEILFKSFQMKSLCGASIDTKGGKIEDVKANGLVLGHAYGVENVVELYSSNGSQQLDSLRTKSPIPNSVRLLRMRNPWGEDVSYKGNWSDTSNTWNNVSDELQKALNCFEKDGQFYISFKDFRLNFDEVQFVHTNMNAMYDEASTENGTWQAEQLQGEWIVGQNAGGCGNENYEDFWQNPQYCLTLNTNEKCSVIISLLQTEQVRKRSETNGTYESSFEAHMISLFKVNKTNKNDKNKFTARQLTPLDTAANSTYLFQRDYTKRIDLLPGQYVVVPSLFDKDRPMKYLLRFFVESANFSLFELGESNNNNSYNNNNNIDSQQTDEIQYNPETSQAYQDEPSNNDQAETEENQLLQSYQSRVFEVPRFVQDQLSTNLSKACSLM